MRQDKDRSGKWLLTHYGDSVLKLAGFTAIRSCRAVSPETVAPRRLPDGLLEVRFEDDPDPALVLVEIETYPSADADRQVFEDLLLLALDRGTVPEVVSLVLRPRGTMAVTGTASRTSRHRTAELSARWRVTNLWELQAEDLLAANDVGLIPWVPLAASTTPPEQLVTRCRDEVEKVADPSRRAGLLAVTQILSALAFPDRRFFDLFGGTKGMITFDNPLFQEVYDLVRLEQSRKVYRKIVLDTLQTRFGTVPPTVEPKLQGLDDVDQLDDLVQVAVTCPSLDEFAAKLP